MATAETGSRAAQLSMIRSFCAATGTSILFDEQNAALMDVYSAKTLPLDPQNLVHVEEQVDKETGQPYLRLLYGNSRQLALAGVGIAFAPDFRNTGPLSELPQAVRSEEHTSELQSRQYLVCRLLLEKKKKPTPPALPVMSEDLAGPAPALTRQPGPA